jgi:hypothetical protein
MSYHTYPLRFVTTDGYYKNRLVGQKLPPRQPLTKTQKQLPGGPTSSGNVAATSSSVGAAPSWEPQVEVTYRYIIF